MNTQNNNQQSITDIFGPVISSYSRKDAINDGVLIPVSELYPNDARIFKYPVCFTNTLFYTIEGSNAGAWVWDICFMAAKWPTIRISESTVMFKCTLPRKKGTTALKAYTLKCMVHPGDNMEPVITISFPNED